jgi:PAS domain S-box-containing protein
MAKTGNHISQIVPESHRVFFDKAQHPVFLIEMPGGILQWANPYAENKLCGDTPVFEGTSLLDWVVSAEREALAQCLKLGQFPTGKSWQLCEKCFPVEEAVFTLEPLPNHPSHALLLWECRAPAIEKASDFQRAIQSSSIVSMADRRGDITYVNDNFVAISGYTREELLGKNHRIINSGYHPRSFWVEMWKTIAKGKTWRAEVKNQAKDGSYYWVDTFVMPFLDAHGKVREYLSIRNDITQRKEQEEHIISLNRSLADFQQAIQSSSIVSMADRRGDITYVNDNFVAISGYTREELLGQNHRIINSGHHPHSFWVEMWKAIAKGKTWRAEVKNQAKDGSYYWVDTFVMPFMDEHGKVREYLSIRNDITQRKEQEEHIISLNHSLADFQQAIQSSSIVSMADRRGDITYVNENFVAISGYTREELLGNNHRIINSGHHPRSFWVEMWKTIAKGKTWRAEVKNQAKDGSYYWVDTFVMPFLDEHGKVREYLSIRNDITENKAAEEEQKELSARLISTLRFARIGTAELQISTGQLKIGEQLLELLDMEASQPLEMPLQEFMESFIHPEDKELIYHKIKQGSNQPVTALQHVHVHFRILTARGKTKYIDALGVFQGQQYALGILQDVTERSKMEQQLRESESRLSSIFNGMISGVVVVDKEVRISYANQSAATILMLEYEEMDQLYNSIVKWVLLDEEEKELPIDEYPLKQALLGKEVVNKIVGVKFKNRYFKWLSVNAAPLYSDQGEITGAVSSFNDITDRKRAQKELFESKKYFESLVNSQTSYIIRTDLEGRYTFVNDKFRDQFSYLNPDMIGSSSLESIISEDHPICSATVEKCLRQPGRVIPVTLRKPRKSGGYYWTEWEFVALVNEKGDPIGIQAVGLDVTMRVKAQQDLIKSEAMLRNIASNIPGGAIFQFQTDAQGGFDVLFISEGIEKVLGVSAKAIARDSQSLFGPLRASIREDLLARMKHVERDVHVVDFSASYTDATGKTRWFTLYSKPIPQEDGTVLWDGVILDKTEKMEAEQAMLKSYRQLRNASGIAQMGEWEVDLRTQQVWWSEEVFHLHGLAPGHQPNFEEAIGYYMPESRKRLEDIIQTAVNKGESFDEDDLEIQDANRQMRWVRVIGVPDKEDGQVVRLFGMIQDVTEQKRGQIELAQKNELMEEMSDIATMGAWEFSVNNNRLLWTDQVYTIYGYPTTAELNLVKAIDHYPGKAAKTIQSCFEACLTKGEAYDVVLPFVALDGKRKWIRTTGRPRKHKGKVVAVSGLFQDITERHELELQMERTLARLSQYRNAVNSASIIAIADEEGLIRFINRNFENISHYKGKDLMGKPFYVLSEGYHPQEMWATMWGKVKTGGIWRGELLSKAQDGNLYWTDTFVIPYIDQQNKISEYLVISNDISKRKLYEQQIRQSLKEKEVIIQELHHRVKNNLQMISSMATMESYFATSSVHSQNLQRLSHRIRIMSGIHERLLHTDTIHTIEAKDYLEQVLSDLDTSFRLSARGTNLAIEIQSCKLSIDTATSVGLVFLEALSIVDDHSNSDHPTGVEVIFQESQLGQFSLKFLSTLALEEGKVDIDKIKGSFSWEMLQTYVQQLGAESEFFVHDTFSFTLQFKDKLTSAHVV